MTSRVWLRLAAIGRPLAGPRRGAAVAASAGAARTSGSRRKPRARPRATGALAASLTALLIGCGSVEVPVETFYRLPAPRPPQSSEPLPAVLRIDRLHLTTNLAGDQLLIADGPVRLLRYEMHRWAGPVDQLVLDALLLGFSRSGGFAQVKGPGDPGAEDLLLSGTIVDFLQVRQADRTVGRVTLELRLADPNSGQEVFRGEFSQTIAAADAGPEAAAVALSEGLGLVVADVVRRAHAAGLAARPR